MELIICSATYRYTARPYTNSSHTATGENLPTCRYSFGGELFDQLGKSLIHTN